MPRTSRIPSYRLHKPSGHAVVTIRGTGGERRDVYLGEYNTPASRAEYGRLVAELATAATPDQVAARTATPELSIEGLLLAFWRWAETHYRRADGTPTNELSEYWQSFKPLRKLYGPTRACDFGPLALKTVRRAMVEAKLCRRLVNLRIGRLKRVFKWAASEQLVPVTVHTALATVSGLQRGRSEARETEPIKPVADEHVLAVLPHVCPEVAAMIEVQLLSGMRPGEVCQLRPCDINKSGAVLLFRPAQFKTLHRGKSRVVAIGPKAQVILAAFTPADPTGYYFSPQRAVARFHASRTAARKTPQYPSHMERNERKRAAAQPRPPRSPTERFTASSYGHAVRRGVEKVNMQLVEAAVEIELHVPHWHPNQLRHSHGTTVRKLFGLEAAGAALGHAKMSATDVYAERDASLAVRVAAAMG